VRRRFQGRTRGRGAARNPAEQTLAAEGDAASADPRSTGELVALADECADCLISLHRRGLTRSPMGQAVGRDPALGAALEATLVASSSGARAVLVERLATKCRHDAEFAKLLGMLSSLLLSDPQGNPRNRPYPESSDSYNWPHADPLWRELVPNVTAGRDAYSAARDINVFISAARDAPYPEAEQPTVQGQSGAAIGTARVLRDLDRVSRGHEASEGTDELALNLLIDRAVRAAFRYPSWLAWPVQRMWLALEVAGVPVSGDRVRGQHGRLREWLDGHGVDPRVLFPRLPEYEEALEQWSPGDGRMRDLTDRLCRALVSELTRNDLLDLPADTLRLLKLALSERQARDFLEALGQQLQETVSSDSAAAAGHAGRTPAERRGLVRTLPDRRWDMTAREHEIGQVASEITKRLSTRRSATVFLSGQPGGGKSVIAIGAAHTLRDEKTFPGGVLYFDMRGEVEYSSDGMAADAPWVAARQVAADILTILGVAGVRGEAIPENDEELYASYTRALKGRQVLVVLDHVLDAGRVRPLLQAGESSCVLVASRKTTADVVPPPRCDWKLDIRAFTREASIELLTKYVEDFDGSLSVRDSTLDNGQLNRIAGYCADLPYALFLAGKEMKSSRYGGDISKRLKLFADALEAESDRLGKLKGIGALISLSYLNLDTAARRALRMSCVTRASGITARELGFCLDIGSDEAEDSLGRLADGSLADYGSGSSYAVYEMVRLFANVRRDVEDSQDAVTKFQLRFVDYIRQQVEFGGGLYPGLGDAAEISAALKAAELAGEVGSPEALDGGIIVADTLVARLPVETELERLSAAQQVLANLCVSSGQVERAVLGWMSFGERMRDISRHKEAINAYQQARTLAGEHEDLSRLKADVAFALALLLEADEDPDLGAAFAAMSDSAETLLALRLPDDEQKILALPLASNCVELAERRWDRANRLRWAGIAADIAQGCDAASLTDRACAMFDLGRALWSGQATDAISSFDLAGQWYEQDGQFENAARAAGNAGALASKEDKEGFFRLAIRRSERAWWSEGKALQAGYRLRLSALLAEEENFEAAIEVLGPVSDLLPDDADHGPQLCEVQMRLLALRFLAGGGADQADIEAAATFTTRVERGDQAQALMLYKLARGLTSVAEERYQLMTLVRNPRLPMPLPAPTALSSARWLNREMGRHPNA
jgi:hypothetical protein